MTEEKSPPPSPPEEIQKLTETLATFAQWVAELIRGRNWFTLLLLLDASLILFGKPVAQFLANLFAFELPQQFSGGLWISVGLIFLAAIIVAVVTMPRPETGEVEFTERKAIKGLRAFTKDDAEVFARLQRERMLRECIEALTNKNFRFGALYGESGCGKTSFLQAGLLSRLSQENSPEIGVYIRFSDKDALATVRKAIVEQLPLTAEEVKDADFLVLITKAAKSAKKPLILFFDQFEQFFVHRKQKADREPFISGLAAWFNNPEPPPVKILFSIRSDLYHNLVEIQQALDYSPSPLEIFRLEKFTPKQATRILGEISAIEGLKFEESFVEEVATQELASREDGLISPVDLQVLAWTIEKQNADELRAFNRLAFQKFGGIEGLLTRFLRRTLDARVTPTQRQAALKVLLALTDLDRGVRAGLLTLEALQEKLKDTVKAEDVKEAVEWLVRGDVRLITPANNAEERLGYELAHEKIIPALRRVAGKELSEADRANQLLDRRVNEWLGNRQNPRYLLNLRELCFIQRQKPYLVWGTNRQQKERLLKASKRRYTRIVAALSLILLLFLSSWGWLISPTGQLWRFRRELANLSIKKQVNSATAAIVFAKNGDWQKAEYICTEKMSSPITKAATLASLAEIAIKLEQPENATELLERAFNSAEKIQSDSDQADALSAIAGAYGELGDAENATELLERAFNSADKIQDDNFKAYALRAIAGAIGELGDAENATELLERAFNSAEKIQSDSDQADALSAIAGAYGELGDAENATELLERAFNSAEKIQYDNFKANALSAIAGAYGELGDAENAEELLQRAFNSAEKIQYDSSKAHALSAIAGAIGELGDAENAEELLQRALNSADKIQDDSSKAWALSAIAGAYGELGDAENATELLQRAFNSADKIQDDSSKAWALSAIAGAIGELGDAENATELLQRALTSADKIQDDSSKAWALSAIALAYVEISKKTNDSKLLQQALDITKKLSGNNRDEVLTAIAEVRATEQNWGKAHQALNLCHSNSCRVEVLAQILTVKAEQENPILVEKEEEE
ncbi:tetratricopeptide repeat protein [Lusitaniella coriacea LEGE 07157]|uniref:Tetratricopeptide repeat protein n=1 Tax=Lusitaniella coriacea LEGE 07157 TaxID=945747 RepID=A0A8J7E0N9_9CYAN|nr:tetratricopeptide repeat protein [Lusitaniella coriacea]MBE9118336.1 tetratricopeptide repeat protein [Lusitaniella coriacea LEGE 07157]